MFSHRQVVPKAEKSHEEIYATKNFVEVKDCYSSNDEFKCLSWGFGLLRFSRGVSVALRLKSFETPDLYSHSINLLSVNVFCVTMFTVNNYFSKIFLIKNEAMAKFLFAKNYSSDIFLTIQNEFSKQVVVSTDMCHFWNGTAVLNFTIATGRSSHIKLLSCVESRQMAVGVLLPNRIAVTWVAEGGEGYTQRLLRIFSQSSYQLHWRSTVQ